MGTRDLPRGISFSDTAAADYRGLGDFERVRVELAARRVAREFISRPGGNFVALTYDLTVEGTAGQDGTPISVNAIRHTPGTVPG